MGNCNGAKRTAIARLLEPRGIVFQAISGSRLLSFSRPPAPWDYRTAIDTLRTKSYRIALFAGIVCIIPLGYGVRFSSALDAPLLQDIGGSLAYQVLVMMVAAFVWPRVSPGSFAAGVFVFSSAIEFLQLCKAPALLAVQATWLGRVILGNTFLWSDFPPYAVGCLLGWGVLRTLRQKFTHPVAR